MPAQIYTNNNTTIHGALTNAQYVLNILQTCLADAGWVVLRRTSDVLAMMQGGGSRCVAEFRIDGNADVSCRIVSAYDPGDGSILGPGTWQTLVDIVPHHWCVVADDTSVWFMSCAQDEQFRRVSFVGDFDPFVPRRSVLNWWGGYSLRHGSKGTAYRDTHERQTGLMYRMAHESFIDDDGVERMWWVGCLPSLEYTSWTPTVDGPIVGSRCFVTEDDEYNIVGFLPGLLAPYHRVQTLQTLCGDIPYSVRSYAGVAYLITICTGDAGLHAAVFNATQYRMDE
ncbi:hypothetical protein [Thermodesulforhabdus norvegica]|uniref:Uncharacterized protein n=1 Tax=Thermodesulforhabdus norvegica TaxID=39841 RepID=A0A1I4SVC9_9BACT|nr:hypothetical protein [Thermodesulforhabdus norvegica]SFM68391.1 hypothetical protein SAMN05660836_01185 [Thermodesulforhabdus norvegica]